MTDFFFSYKRKKDSNSNVWLQSTFSDPLRSLSFRNTKILLMFVCHWALELTQLYSCFEVALSSHLPNVLSILFPGSYLSCPLSLLCYFHTHPYVGFHFSLNIIHTLHLKTLFMNDAKIAFFEEILLSHNCIHMKLKTCFII